MNYIDSIYGKYQHLVVQPCYRKARLNGTDFLIVMNDNLETFYLASTAKEIIETISNGIKVDDLYQKMQTEYEIDATTLKSDILEFLKDMQWKRVICLSA